MARTGIALILLLALQTNAAADVDLAAKLLTEAAEDKNALRRKQAMAALENAGAHPKAVALAEAGLSDKDVDVRQTAAIALGGMRSRRSMPKLRKALDDEAPEVIFAAAQALWVMGDRTGRDIFVEALAGDRSDSSGAMKGAMRDARRRIRNPGALALIGVRQGAGMLLGPFSLGINVFEELVKDGGASARTLSAALLSKDTDPATIYSLEAGLNDKNWIVRSAAAKALAERGSRKSSGKIAALLTDEKEGARLVAAACLLRLSRGSAT